MAVRDKGAVQHLDSASHGRDKGAIEASVAGGASYTATTALTSAATTLSSSGTFTAPTDTGAASLSSAASTLAATGTFVGPTYTGSSALTTQASTLSATGTHSPPGASTGTASLTTPASILSSSGTSTVPTYTGSAALTTPASTLSATGVFATEVYSASANLQAAATSITAMGAFEAPEYTATVSLTTPASTFSGSGTFAAPVEIAVHNLEAFWSLTSNANDDHSHSKNLTNVGTVTFGTDGATFGDGQVLQITGLTPTFEMRLVPGMSSYAVGAIARHTEIPSGDAILVTRQSADDDTDQFKLWYDGAAGQVKFWHRLYRTSTYVTVAIDYTPEVDTPYLALGWRDADDDTLHLAVVDADGVTLDSETGATQGLHSSRSLFRIGGGPSGVDSALAEIKAAAFIRDTLSDWTEADFSAWFNSGDGPAYGDLTLTDDTLNANDAPWESIATVASPWVSTDDLGSRGVFFWSVIDLAEIRPAIAASSGRFAHFWGTNHGNNPATNGIFLGYSASADEPPASGTKIWAEGANTTEGLQPETPDIEYVADTDLFHLYGHVDRGGGYQATHVRTSSDLVTWSDQSVVAIATEGTDLHTGYADVHQPESFGESTWTASHLRNNYSGFSTSEDGFAPWTRDPETTDETTFAPPGYRVRIADGRFKMGGKVYSLARFSGPDSDAGLCIVEMALENGIYRQPVGVPYRVHTDTEVYPEPGWTIIGRPYVVDNVLSIYRTGGFYRAASPNYEQVDLIAVTWAGALVPDDSRIWQAPVRQTIWRAPKRVTVWRT